MGKYWGKLDSVRGKGKLSLDVICPPIACDLRRGLFECQGDTL